jgi:hypothetical protein
MGCDQCIEGCCSMEWCTCSGDTTYGLDDAGMPQVTGGCLAFVACVQDCVYPPDGGTGGTVQACSGTCASVAGGNQQAMEGGNLLTCIVGNCAGTGQCAK